MLETETTRLQQETENECTPFFVELSSLSRGQLEHLCQVGLLKQRQPLDEDATDEDGHHDDMSQVQLLREKHSQYLQQVWNKPLKSPFVSLDSSRPWILYWCLHGYDLMQGSVDSNNQHKTLVTNEKGCNMVATLEDCWHSYFTTKPPALVLGGNVSKDDDAMQTNSTKDPFYFARHEQDIGEEGGGISSNQPYQFYCGGFGGGPGQLAHAATTYASILALCILATDDDDRTNYCTMEHEESDGSCDDTSSSSSDDIHYSVLAQRLLQKIRVPLYRWMVSLQEPLTGGYRMHHDGEVDVRATYTLIVCAKLLDLLPASSSSSSSSGVLQRQQVIDFVVSCQTYEGGLGGEPFSEAHGGYTFCGAAALKLMGALDERSCQNNDGNGLDISALLGWLARRQMAYEGGFSGRCNKLVDGCYSFWQGGAMAIVSSCYVEGETPSSKNDSNAKDPWLERYERSITKTSNETDTSWGLENLPFPLLFDVAMLERYILLCAQEVHGGLRDKPSKPRDFYHTCYNLCGLSVTQHCSQEGKDNTFGDAKQTRLAPTHPVYNIRIDRVSKMLKRTWVAPKSPSVCSV